MKGTYTYIMGTGKYERIKGGDTWESFSLGSVSRVTLYETDVPRFMRFFE
jgi:hypothetical protein